MIKNRYLKFYNAAIVSLMAFLDFACSSSIEPVEYGTPSAKFIVNGTVSSEESNEPVRNIRVVMQNDTAYTDQEGNYQVADDWGFPTDQTYVIKFTDIDHEQNGAYHDLDSIVEFKDPEFTGGDGKWYSGETSKELDIKLTPKK
ncbi:MAG: radical SAM-associated putative lipoprotein [Thiohalospira sp.]